MQDHSLQQHKHNWADRSLELPRNVPKSQLPYCCSLLSHIKHWPKICLCICYHIIYYRSATQRQTQNLKQSVCRATNYGCNCSTMRGLDLLRPGCSAVPVGPLAERQRCEDNLMAATLVCWAVASFERVQGTSLDPCPLCALTHCQQYYRPQAFVLKGCKVFPSALI